MAAALPRTPSTPTARKAEILAGKTLKIEADTLTNDYGILSARLSAALKATTLTNRSYGAIQTENLVVRAAYFNCHQTVRYHDSWGGVIESGGAVTIDATTVNNLTTDTRDGAAGLSTDPRVVKVDERAGTQSPLTKAFVDRFGIVNGPANSTAGSGPTVNLGSPRRLSDNLVLTWLNSWIYSLKIKSSPPYWLGWRFGCTNGSTSIASGWSKKKIQVISF